MQDTPTPAEIIASTARMIRERLLPHLPPREQFEARVAANALEIALRDITIGQGAEVQELQRLRTILNQDGDLETLNRALAEAIRNGTCDPAAPSIAAHLWQTTLEKLAVDQPNYAAYRRAITTGDTK